MTQVTALMYSPHHKWEGLQWEMAGPPLHSTEEYQWKSKANYMTLDKSIVHIQSYTIYTAHLITAGSQLQQLHNVYTLI